MKRQLHVKNMAGETVHSVDVSDGGAHWYRRVMAGMLINMSDEYYVDSSEFNDVVDPAPLLSEVFREERGA